MKKIITIILSLITVCCSIFSISCDNLTKENPDTPPPSSNTVNENTDISTLASDQATESEWNNAIPTQMYDNFTIKVSFLGTNYSQSQLKETIQAKFVKKNDKILTYNSVESSGTVSYAEYTPETVKAYSKTNDNPLTPVANEQIETMGLSYELAIAQCSKPLFKFNGLSYADFTWNETEKCYDYAEIVNTTLNLIGVGIMETTEPLRNLKVKIVKGTAVAITGEACYGQNNSYVYPFTFLLYDLDKTEITIPQI